MTTLAHLPVSLVQSTPKVEARQQFVLYNVAWDDYIKIGEALSDRPGLRLTYDQGMLELMTTSTGHERYKQWLGRFVETIAEELNKPIMPGGSMTFQRADVKRGFEPDNCFWIANENVVRHKMTWDARTDPPPDLILEIEVSRTIAKRMAIFAAFRVPEVWTYDGEELRIYLLQPDGKYQLSEVSLAFPTIPVHELARFFSEFEKTDYLSVVAAVRAWVRSVVNKPA